MSYRCHELQRATQIVLLVLLLTCPQVMATGNRLPEKDADHQPGLILVKFKEGVPKQTRKMVRQGIDADLLEYVRSIDLEIWRLPYELSAGEAIELLEHFDSIEYVEPDYLYKPMLLPDDPLFSKLWYLNSTGQIVNSIAVEPGVDVQAPLAWNIETGNSNVVIAVIDSGVALDHPDLKNNIWNNEDEIMGNGIDDDNNGFIDDLNGWDFVNNDNNPSDYSRDLYGDGHGTHVAGIISAEGNNGLGSVGLMWRSQLMPLQVFDLFQVNTFSANRIQSIRIIQAVEYAVDNHADIINCSFGGSIFSNALYDIYAYADRKGVLVIAAAGNESKDNDIIPTYPASYSLPNIISVAATDESGHLASYSNFGAQSVDICSPGGGTKATILNTVPPERKVLFDEDFNSGAGNWDFRSRFEDWVVVFDDFFDSYVLHSNVQDYASNEDSFAELAFPIEVKNNRGLHLEFDLEYALEESYDYFFLELSEDGKAYEPIYAATGFSDGVLSFLKWNNDKDLSTLRLRFRLMTDKSITHRGVWIDNLQLTGIPWEFNGHEFDYKRGTSMAAPLVTGTAGLIRSLNPDLTHTQIKNIILDSARHVPSLQGKVASQGIADVHQALLKASKELNLRTRITAQGESETYTAQEGQVLTVRVDFAPGIKAGSPGEMWVVADTPFGVFSYVFPEGWISGIRPAIQGNLQEVRAFPVWEGSLPQGEYVFYFSVDESGDGEAQFLWWDGVQVVVQ